MPDLAFLVLSFLVAFGCLALGPYPVTKFAQDTMYVLSEGDLLLKGMRPYVDYYSLHGPVPFLFFAAAMQFYGVSLKSIVLGQVLGGLTMGLLSYKIARSRTSGFWAVFLAIAVELILVSCTPVGSKSWREFTCAMWYNSLGYCIDATVFLYLLAPSRSRSKSSLATDHLIVATLLMASFLTKASYSLPLSGVFVMGTIVLPRNRQMRLEGLAVIASAVAMTFAVMIALRGSIIGYVDFLSVMKVKVSPLMLALRFLHYTRTIGFFLLGAGLLAWSAHEMGLVRRLLREAVLVVLMFGCLMVSAATSAQDLEIVPLLGVVLLGAAIAIVSAAHTYTSLPPNKYLIASSLGVALLLMVHTPKNSILSWVFSHTKVPTLADPVERAPLSAINSLQLALSPSVDPRLLASMPKSWTDEQASAILLLQRNGFTKSDVLFAASDVSFLNVLTGAQYPHAFVAWWPFIYIEEPEKIRLLDENLLSDADWLIRDATYERFWKYLELHRGDYLHAHFEQVDENGQWTLYRRRAH